MHRPIRNKIRLNCTLVIGAIAVPCLYTRIPVACTPLYSQRALGLSVFHNTPLLSQTINTIPGFLALRSRAQSHLRVLFHRHVGMPEAVSGMDGREWADA